MLFLAVRLIAFLLYVATSCRVGVVGTKIFGQGTSARVLAFPSARSERRENSLGQGECRAASSDLAAVRRSPRSREYAIYKSRTVPQFRVLALEGCTRISAEPARQNLQDLMRGALALATRRPLRRRLALGLLRTLWHYARSRSRTLCRGRKTDLRILAQQPGIPLGPRATLRAPQEPLHLGTTSPSCRSAPVRGSAPRRNRYVDARTPGNRLTRPSAPPTPEPLCRNDAHRPRVLLRPPSRAFWATAFHRLRCVPVLVLM